MMENTELWISQYKNPSADFRLICFPHAGGPASFFHQWPKELDNYEICSVRYPGRAERIEEDQPADLCILGQQIASAIQPLNDLPMILFGHSMGAAVALEAAKHLESSGCNVAHLIASGSRNGPLPKKGLYTQEDDESLCKHLVEMGGTDPDAVNDPIFLDLVLPSIRADGKMFYDYNMTPGLTLKCPITTIIGDSDYHADIRPWEEVTQSEFNEITVKGDHFYLIGSPPYDLIKKISEPTQKAEIKSA